MYSKLKGARTEKGLTQTDMAKLLGISQNTYYLKEAQKVIISKHGKKIQRDFSLTEANKILTILNKNYEDIFLK